MTTTIELKDTDGAFVVSADGSFEMYLPELEETANIPPYLYILLIMSMKAQDNAFLESAMDEFMEKVKDIQPSADQIIDDQIAQGKTSGDFVALGLTSDE